MSVKLLGVSAEQGIAAESTAQPSHHYLCLPTDITLFDIQS